jgi:hypothetical protein
LSILLNRRNCNITLGFWTLIFFCSIHHSF